MIVMLTQCFPPVRGGIENLMGGLADALHAAGQPLTVLADSSAASRMRPDDFAYPVRRFGGLKFLRRWHKMGVLMGLTPTAIIADSWKSIQSLPSQTVPVIMLAHGMEFPARPRAEKATRIRAAVARASVVVANSAYTAVQARPYLSPHIKVTIIHPPIGPQPEAGALPAEYMGASPRLVSLSRLEPRKGVDMVIRAMPNILQSFPNAAYVIAGGGDDRARLEALATELGVSARVKFTGPVDAQRKADLLAHADLFVMPARREGDSVEGFGISYIEAAWYGVPALAGSDGGAPDAVLAGVTGLLCDGANEADVEAKLLQLLNDEMLRSTLGDAARERARGEMQWDEAVQRYMALVNAHRA